MATIDQQFIEYIVKALVNNPDDVIVDRRVDEKGVLLELTVNPEDLGRVIGKRGVTAQSLRTLLRALGTKNDARYNLKIVNNDQDQPASTPNGDDAAASSDQPQTAQSDDASSDQPAQNDEPVQNSDTGDVDKESDRMRNTRKELAELDDLDI
jgi:predicted RNA-binding protein YlqC (UPF0109 family)